MNKKRNTNRIESTMKNYPKIAGIIILINIFVYLFNLFTDGSMLPWICSPSMDSLSVKEVYRFVTLLFCHVNPIHLVVNILAIWCVGLLLENQIKSSRYLFIFLVGGFLAEVTFCVLYGLVLDLETAGGGGGSAAVFSMIGCAVVLYLRKSSFVRIKRGTWGVNYLVGYSLLSNLFGVNALVSHVLGLVYGVVLTLIVIRKDSSSQ